MILACPTCDSRYDVSGYAVGQQFRCRCGTVTTLQAPPAGAATLACPHCGAAASPDAPRCAYCNRELLVKACPRCLQRVFSAYEHCPGCGAELDLAADGEQRSDLPCPRCNEPLHAKLVGDVLIDECTKCHGLFLDHAAIRRLLEERRQARAEAVLGTLPRVAVAAVRPGERMYIKCPRCNAVMNRKLFATGAGVIVDVCRAHGTFFDAGELPAIVDFVMKGGLEQAERKDLERERQRVELEKLDLQRATASTTWTDQSSYASHADAFVSLLAHLIR